MQEAAGVEEGVERRAGEDGDEDMPEVERHDAVDEEDENTASEEQERGEEMGEDDDEMEEPEITVLDRVRFDSASSIDELTKGQTIYRKRSNSTSSVDSKGDSSGGPRTPKS